jgi:hypothetical protein
LLWMAQHCFVDYFVTFRGHSVHHRGEDSGQLLFVTPIYCRRRRNVGSLLLDFFTASYAEHLLRWSRPTWSWRALPLQLPRELSLRVYLDGRKQAGRNWNY